MDNQIINALFALAGIIIKSMFDYLMLRLKTNANNKKSLATNINRSRRIYSIMQRMVQTTSVDRFLIFRVHNGGGNINFNTPIYLSILYEQYNAPLNAIMDDYQRILLDRDYLELISELENKKVIRVETKDLNVEVIRVAYEAAKLKYSEMYYITHNASDFYFCSLSTTTESMYQNPNDALQIRNGIDNIRTIFKQGM